MRRLGSCFCNLILYCCYNGFMIITTLAVLIRIISNSMSNVYQKQLTARGLSPFLINFIMYSGLFVCCVPVIFGINWGGFGQVVWINSLFGGICGALGNSYLVKALERGELSILGPINAYKSVVAMIAGIVILKEIPSLTGIAAIVLIIAGSYVIFETQDEGFSLKLLRRSDIRYRIYALVFTAVEAVFIKNVILYTDVKTSFVFWCLFGMLFTGLIVLRKRSFLPEKNGFVFTRCLLVILLMGLMQYSTNFVFSRMNVSYGLALFQLSSVLSVLLGWKFFSEKNILKKLFGSIVMVAGAVILILFN